MKAALERIKSGTATPSDRLLASKVAPESSAINEQQAKQLLAKAQSGGRLSLEEDNSLKGYYDNLKKQAAYSDVNSPEYANLIANTDNEGAKLQAQKEQLRAQKEISEKKI